MQALSISTLSWDDPDDKAVDTARILAADTAEKVGDGDPGTTMSRAPLAYLLFQKVMRRAPHAPNGTPDVILLSSGSEVQIAVDAREQLKAEGINARVVSVPCQEWFEEQSAEYRESVLPAAVKARVSIEAGISLTWKPYVGDAGRSVSIEHFGASADYKTLYREFGMTTEATIAAVKDSLAAAAAA